MIHPTYPSAWNKREWINQSCLPPLPLATEAVQTPVQLRDFTSGRYIWVSWSPLCAGWGALPGSWEHSPGILEPGCLLWPKQKQRELSQPIFHLMCRLMCLSVTHWANSLHVWETELDPERKSKIGLSVFPRGCISHLGAEDTWGCPQRSTALPINTGKQSPHHPSLEVLSHKGYCHLYSPGFSTMWARLVLCDCTIATHNGTYARKHKPVYPYWKKSKF